MKIDKARRLWWRFEHWLETDAERWILIAIALWLALGVGLVTAAMVGGMR